MKPTAGGNRAEPVCPGDRLQVAEGLIASYLIRKLVLTSSTLVRYPCVIPSRRYAKNLCQISRQPTLKFYIVIVEIGFANKNQILYIA